MTDPNNAVDDLDDLLQRRIPSNQPLSKIEVATIVDGLPMFFRRPATSHLLHDGIAEVACGIPTSKVVRAALEQADLTVKDLPDANQCLAKISGGLAAPRALRALIERYHIPVSHSSNRLRVLYVGGGFYETMDQGRWFDLYHKIDPNFPMVEMTVVGPEFAGVEAALSAGTPMGRMVLPKDRINAPPRLIHSTLDAAFSENKISIDQFDLVVVHHPEFFSSQPINLRDDRAFRSLLRAPPCPIVGTSFSAIDFQMNRHAAYAMGVTLEEPVHFIGAHHQLYDHGINCDVRWGQILWRVGPKREFLRDEHRSLVDAFFEREPIDELMCLSLGVIQPDESLRMDLADQLYISLDLGCLVASDARGEQKILLPEEFVRDLRSTPDFIARGVIVDSLLRDVDEVVESMLEELVDDELIVSGVEVQPK